MRTKEELKGIVRDIMDEHNVKNLAQMDDDNWEKAKRVIREELTEEEIALVKEGALERALNGFINLTNKLQSLHKSFEESNDTEGQECVERMVGHIEDIVEDIVEDGENQ